MLLLLFKCGKICPFPIKWRARRARADINSVIQRGEKRKANKGFVLIKTLLLDKFNI